MTAADPSVGLFTADVAFDDFNAGRIRWLIRIRWVAMAGVAAAALMARAGLFPGVAWPLLITVALGGALYNFFLWRGQHLPTTGRSAGVRQALVDLVLLTTVLWAAGGLKTPFIGYYVFHVALIAILGGPRATLIAGAAAAAGAGFLALVELIPALQIGVWEPVEPWGTVSAVVAFVSTIGAAAYVVTHAVRELRDRERELVQASARSELEYQVITNTLEEIDAGLEIIDVDGRVQWQNSKAHQLHPQGDKPWTCLHDTKGCSRDRGDYCPVEDARVRRRSGRCRFDEEGQTYELLSLPIGGSLKSAPRVMNLYLDRTQTLLTERRLLVAERLASLGRISQGVAHELNTPLATIQTLAADMRKLAFDREPEVGVMQDIRESAGLIRDETARLGRITQALLAGGDLQRPQTTRAVKLLPLVERAVALVFAGQDDRSFIHVDGSVVDVEVEADADRIVQVLVNLLQNARDAVRESGGQKIEVSARSEGRLAQVIIADDGAGIDHEIASRLFEPFATTKPPGQGTGLGLYASYMLVQSMGGELALHNEPDGGARATLTLRTSPARAQQDAKVDAT